MAKARKAWRYGVLVALAGGMVGCGAMTTPSASAGYHVQLWSHWGQPQTCAEKLRYCRASGNWTGYWRVGYAQCRPMYRACLRGDDS